MSLIKHCPDCEKPVEASAGSCTHCGADLKWGAGRGSLWLKLQERFARAATRYEIDRLIGYGGMAGVYLAWDKKLGRSVALKLIQPAVAVDPRMVRRFFQEAQTMAQLGHEHIVQIYDMDESDDLVWMSMQYVPGRTLGEVLNDSGVPLPPDLVCTWLSAIASALAHAHGKATPVIHRDVKPSNILLNENGKALLTDFGIAKLQGESGLTRTSHLIGTPAYMSPEQCQGGSLGPASDQYSLGTVAFELLAGVPPFKGPTLVVLQSHRDETAPDILEFRPDLPQGLAEVVRRMLAKRPEDRWPSMTEAAEQFRKQIREPVPPRRLAAWSKRVHSIAITAKPDHLTLGTSEKLIAQALDHEGRELDGRRVRWSSTDERVAFVSPDGVVAGLGVGSALIVAETGRAQTTVELRVQEPTVHHVSVSPPTLELPAGGMRTLVVTCYSRTGDTVVADAAFQVDRPEAVAVTDEGVVTGLSPGEAVVTVLAGGQREEVRVRVVAAPVGSILVSTPNVTLALGQSAPIPVEVRGTDGRVQTGAALWWTSSDDSTVAVSGTGVLRGVGLGRATITASAGSASATLDVQVVPSQASVNTEAIGRPRPGGGGSPPADATLVFQGHSQPDEIATNPATVQGGGPTPPSGATVVFQGPEPQDGGPPPETPTPRQSSEAQPKRPVSDRAPMKVRRQRGWLPALGKAEAIAIGSGLLGAAAVIWLLSIWPSSSPPVIPVAVAAAPRDTTIIVGQDFQYRLQSDDPNPIEASQLRWGTSDASIVFVSQSGLARAVGEGSAVISLEGEALEGGRAELVVTVVGQPPVGQLSILGPQQVRVGTSPLQYRLQDADGSAVDDPGVAWIVEPGTIATVSPTGQLTARAAGIVRLSAALNGRTASTEVRIAPREVIGEPPPQPRDIRIAGTPAEAVQVGTEISLDAWLVDEDEMTVPGQLSWTTSNPGILRQTGPSSFQAVAAGNATLQVTSNAPALRRSVNVTTISRVVEIDPNRPTQLVLAQADIALTVGQTSQLNASALNGNGDPIADISLEWSAASPGIASVSSSGTVQAVAAGTTFVLVRAGGVVDSTRVSVTAAVVPAAPTDADGRREAARYYSWFAERDVGSLTSLIPADQRGRHQAFLDLVQQGRLNPEGPATDQAIDGESLSFSIPAEQRTNFGNRLSRRLDFICRLSQDGETWGVASCVLGPSSYVPGG